MIGLRRSSSVGAPFRIATNHLEQEKKILYPPPREKTAFPVQRVPLSPRSVCTPTRFTYLPIVIVQLSSGGLLFKHTAASQTDALFSLEFFRKALLHTPASPVRFTVHSRYFLILSCASEARLCAIIVETPKRNDFVFCLVLFILGGGGVGESDPSTRHRQGSQGSGVLRESVLRRRHLHRRPVLRGSGVRLH